MLTVVLPVAFALVFDQRLTAVFVALAVGLYGAAFGAIQQVPQIVPALPEVRAMTQGRPPVEARPIEQRVASDVRQIRSSSSMERNKGWHCARTRS